MAKAFGSRQQLSGADILGFLRTFEGAAATFSQDSGHWSLWLPEFSPDGHPLTPASQIFFPVILRRDDQAFAIRFFYDCATGKVRYYTSAIPEEIAWLPELENAISELFRHSLPVEPIRQRSLGRKNRRAANEPPLVRPTNRQSLADPDDRSVPAAFHPGPAKALPASAAPVAEPAPKLSAVDSNLPVVAGNTAPEMPRIREDRPPGGEKTFAPAGASPAITTLIPRAVPPPEPVRVLTEIPPAAAAPPPRPREVTRTVRVEIGPAARSVLLAFVLVMGALLLCGIGAYVYLRVTQDPGVEHHRLQIEEMRLRNGG